jgi:sentrin-specific protease 1
LRPPVKALPPTLPAADDQLVDTVLSNRGFTSKYAREQVSNNDIIRLLPKQWLNDEIINFYGAMILGRSEAAVNQSGKKTFWDVHYFNSFFWTKLTKEGYEKGRLAKWTKKMDIFSKDAILLPVNHNNTHWTAAAINFRNKRFESYDSMGLAAEVVFKVSKLYCAHHYVLNEQLLQVLRSYVNLEHQNKKKKAFDFTGWTNWAPDVSLFARSMTVNAILTGFSRYRLHHSKKMDMIAACLHASSWKHFHGEKKHSISHRRICPTCAGG